MYLRRPGRRRRRRGLPGARICRLGRRRRRSRRLPARQALPRARWWRRHRRAARAREAADGAVLRAGHEPARDRRRDGRHRVARVPVAQPGGGPPAQQAQALVEAGDALFRAAAAGAPLSGLDDSASARRLGSRALLRTPGAAKSAARRWHGHRLELSARNGVANAQKSHVAAVGGLKARQQRLPLGAGAPFGGWDPVGRVCF
ncbi:MAG: hypothetical protein MZV64_48580 [Ignavibacteriales bacterium]|nr:hypothetical protein [Ignavibacteriales bacterium]